MYGEESQVRVSWVCQSFSCEILSENLPRFCSLGATLMDARERARNSVFYTSGAQILEGTFDFE